MVPSRVNEPLSCPGSGGSRDSAKGSARGGTRARRPRLQTLLRGTRPGAGPGARRAGPGALRPLCHPHCLPPPGPDDPGASPCSAPWRPPTLAGPKGTRASLPATSGPLITSAAHCQDLAGGHAPGGRDLEPGRQEGWPSEVSTRPDPPLRAASSPQLPGRGHQPSALGAHGVAREPPALARATTRARPTSSGGRTSSAPWVPGAPSPALALPAPLASGEMPPRRAGALLGREPGDPRCARPPPQELGDMLVNWFHSAVCLLCARIKP